MTASPRARYVLRQGRAHGLALPANEMLYGMIKVCINHRMTSLAPPYIIHTVY